MFADIKDVRKTRKVYNGKMIKSGIDTFRKIAEIEAEALKDGALARKHKELIALGISIGKACYG